MAGLADITATVLAMAGLGTETEALDGRPLLPLSGHGDATAGFLFSWYDPKGRNFPTGAVAMSPTRRLYADGRMTLVEASPECCILRELDSAQTGAAADGEPQLRELLLMHDRWDTH